MWLCLVGIFTRPLAPTTHIPGRVYYGQHTGGAIHIKGIRGVQGKDYQSQGITQSENSCSPEHEGAVLRSLLVVGLNDSDYFLLF